MLRALFGESRRQDEGPLKEANDAIRQYMNALIPSSANPPGTQERRFLIWSENFLRALDELEQSGFAAERYAGRVTRRYVDEMTEEERDDYNRHLYYYKNAIIRMFAILDKLGHFLDERFQLRTERYKARFSYFTVLRNMHENGIHTDLEQRLYELKQATREPANRLRNQRNMEIHTINSDLLDDLLQAAEAKYDRRPRQQTDEIRSNVQDLKAGIEMTCRAVSLVFGYLLQADQNRSGTGGGHS
ncbi:hypothetical protein LJK87_27820 [Paenibacillus sp. P25]|nr:hypothetical protein LJK87_27820 [Paenibacillus sp. P25]